MRYLLPLLLFPSLSYAGCHPGVNYGQYPITAGNPVCAPYSGSSLGGCVAYCGGAAGNTLCVEFPLASPPTKGPYTTNGNECQYYTGSDSNSSGNSGGNNSGTDGTNQNPNGLVDVGAIMVGDKYVTDFGKGFNVVANNVNQSAAKVQKSVSDLAKQLDNAMDLNNARYMDPFLSNLSRIAQNTSGMSEGGASTVDFEIAGYLKSINDKSVLDPTMWNNHHAELMGVLHDIRKDISYVNGTWPQEQSYLESINANLSSIANGGGGGGGGLSEGAINSIYQLDDNVGQLKEVFAGDYSPYLKSAMDSAQLLSDISGKLDKISNGSGGDGEGNGGEGDGDKPCEGPLCTFMPPSSSGSGSGLSSVFGEQDIAGIKQQVTERKADIQEQMDQIKGVFSPGKLQVSGSYENDYHDINGANIDLSGKSNIELFFSLGPKQVIWFLAVLIAFGILLGGRKDA